MLFWTVTFICLLLFVAFVLYIWNELKQTNWSPLDFPDKSSCQKTHGRVIFAGGVEGGSQVVLFNIREEIFAPRETLIVNLNMSLRLPSDMGIKFSVSEELARRSGLKFVRVHSKTIPMKVELKNESDRAQILHVGTPMVVAFAHVKNQKFLPYTENKRSSIVTDSSLKYKMKLK